MAQSQIRVPSIEELKAAYSQPATFDPSKLTAQYATGMTLQDTIAQKALERKKAEEDLKKEIAAAQEMAAQQKRLEQFRQSPTDATAAVAYPELKAKKLFEKPQKTFTKVGETPSEIIMADLTNPDEVKRISAPGLVVPGGKGGEGKTLPSSLLSNLLKTKGVGDFIENLQKTTDKMSQSSGLGGVLSAAALKGQEKAGGFFGGDPDVIAYEKSRPTMGRAVYKFFSGDVGNISENEGKFATDLLPSAYEDPAIRSAKLARLKDFKGKSEEALAQVLAFAKTSGLGPKETEEAIKNASLQVMQSAVATPLSQYQQSPESGAPAASTGNAGGLSPEKAARLQELRKKKAQGTLRG